MLANISAAGFFIGYRSRKGQTVVMAATFDFTCPNGHKFSAIAKLRARCPECGITARRDFTATSARSTPSTSTVLSRKVAHRKDTVSGLSSDSTSTKEDPSSSTVKKVVRSVSRKSTVSTLPTKKPIVVKRGLPRTMPKTVKQSKATTPPKPNVTRGPVRKVAAKRGHVPQVTKKPRGSRERKVVEQTKGNKRFWEQVKEQYFR